MAALSGKKSPSSDDIKKILSAVGIEADDAVANCLIKCIDGKSPFELIASGLNKLQNISGTAVMQASSPAGTPAAAAGASAATAATPAKEEKKEEEEDDDLGFSLFD